MNADFMNNVKGYIDRNKKKKRFVMSACALSLCTVFGVYSVLLQPAVSREKQYLLLESQRDKGIYGEVLTLDVTASAKPGQEETCFLISAKSRGARLAETYSFEDDVVVVETEDGGELKLHRENQSGKTTDYWFVLEEGESVTFSLDCESIPFDDESDPDEDIVWDWDEDDDDEVQTATASDAVRQEMVVAAISVHETDVVRAAGDQESGNSGDSGSGGGGKSGDSDGEGTGGSDDSGEAGDTESGDSGSGESGGNSGSGENNGNSGSGENGGNSGNGEAGGNSGGGETGENSGNGEVGGNSGNGGTGGNSDGSETGGNSETGTAGDNSETGGSGGSADSGDEPQSGTSAPDGTEGNGGVEGNGGTEGDGGADSEGNSGDSEGNGAVSGGNSADSETTGQPDGSETVTDETGKETDPGTGNVPETEPEKLPEAPEKVEKPKAPEELDEFAEELSLDIRYIAGDSLEDCRAALEEDGYSLTLTWLNEEELIKEGIATLKVEVDQEEANAGEEIIARVSASLTEEAEEEKIVSLLVDSEQAGLSDDYSFDGGICRIEDMDGGTIELHRQKTSSRNVIQYWFALEPGSDIEFELSFIDEVDLDLTGGGEAATPSEADEPLQVRRATESEAQEAGRETNGEEMISQATPSLADEVTGSELEVSAELELYAGVGDSRRKAGTAAMKQPPVLTQWFKEGTFILTHTFADGSKVTLTAPGGAFPGAENLELSVRQLEGEEAEAARQLIRESVPEGEPGYFSLGLWDITILDNEMEVQPQKPVVVTFLNIQDAAPETNPVIFHIDEENDKVEDMNATVGAGGEMTIETDHFSTYAAVRAEDIGTAAGSSEAIAEPVEVTEGQLAPYNRLNITDNVDGQAEITASGAGVINTQTLEPRKTGTAEGDLWNGNWSDAIKGPYADFNENYGAIAVQFKGSDSSLPGYSTGTSVGWDQRDLSLETTTMSVTVKYKAVGTYDEKPIGAMAEISVTPMKNRNDDTWGRNDYNGVYYPTIQISRSLYSGWDWQNVKEFHVGLTFYYLDANGNFGEPVILNEGVDAGYGDRMADYYTINSLNPAYIHYAGEGYNWHNFGPEYVLPDDAQNVKAYRISPVSGETTFPSHITTGYYDSKYGMQYAYNGGTEEWSGDKTDRPNWLQNSVMIIPPADTRVLGFTMGNLMRTPDISGTGQSVPHTDNMWATFSSTALTQQQKIERTSVAVNKVWAGEESQSHNPVEVSLFADGQDTGMKLTLSDENGWSGTFDNLSVYPDDDNRKPKIAYTVAENSVPGYSASYEYGAGTEAYWVKATSFEENESYALVYSTDSAVANISGTALSKGTVTRGSGEVEIDGKTYSDYLTAAEDAVLWTADGTGQKSVLMNVHTGKKLSLVKLGYNSYQFKAQPTGSTITYNSSSGRLSAVNSSNNLRYLQNNAEAVSSSNSATSYTLYKKVAAASGSLAVTITNRPVTVVEPENPQFVHNKRIDYLGDGIANPDTGLAGDDFYRLYLDMTGKREPTDVLFVVDRSGSMGANKDVPDGSGTLTRDQAIEKVLNGAVNSKNDSGLISTFMAMNKDNKYAVVSFQGDTGLGYNLTGTTGYTYGNGWRARNGYSYKKDSSDLAGGWQQTAKMVQTDCISGNGTNYEAGLLRAADLMDQVKNDGNRKLMIFLSDGVPTYYITNAGDRWGNGGFNDTNNYPYCTKPSKAAFDDFRKAYPEVTTYTIGVSKDISDVNYGTSQSPEVLQYMAENGGGKFYGVESTQELRDNLLGILYPSHVTITDHLSQYVEWYGEQPDVKVTRTSEETGETVILYENGRPTSAGEGVVQNVSYSRNTSPDSGSTGTVKVTFAPEYHLEPVYTYTLSFNVRTAQTAYDEYKGNLNQGGSGYGQVRGDEDTDYASNHTSSMQPGFHSNQSADVSYVVADTAYTEAYRHPVIQVMTADLNLLKRGESASGPVLGGVEFALYRAQVGADGAWTKDGEPVKTGVSGQDGTLGFAGLMGGNYLLFETKTAAGFVLSEEPWRVTVAKRAVTVTDSRGNPVQVDGSTFYHVLINQKIFELPSTGGTGTSVYTAGGLLMILSAGLMYIEEKKRREVKNP